MGKDNTFKTLYHRLNKSGKVYKIGKYRKSQSRNQKITQNEADLLQYINSKSCQICKKQHQQNSLLLCDRCDDAYHTFCLKPPINHQPGGFWVCYQCQKDMKIKQDPQPISNPNICYKCNKDLHQIQIIKIFGPSSTLTPIPLQYNQPQQCLYCQNIYHSICFSSRNNSLNCQSCQAYLRSQTPKNHQQFLAFIQQQSQIVSQSFYQQLNPLRPNDKQGDRLRFLNLKIPQPLSQWQMITQHQTSLYYALRTKNYTLVDQQIYLKGKTDLNLNDARRQGAVPRLSLKDEITFLNFKKNIKQGSLGPFEIRQDRIKGFYLVATGFIDNMTIICQYVGQVMNARDSLLEQANDSIFVLLRAPSSVTSLDIVPTRFCNISRFFSGLNNNKDLRQFTDLENIKVLRFQLQGRIRLLFYTKRQVQAGEIMYFDYNGSAFQQYPTENFTL